MKVSNVLRYAIHLIVLGIFNVFFFIIGGTEHPVSVWIAYGCVNLAYLIIMAMPFFVQKGKDSATFAAVSYGISTTYFFVELVVGSIIIAVAPEDYRWSLLPQLLLMAIYLIVLFSNRIADEHTAEAVKKREAEVSYIKHICAMMRPLVDEAPDKQTRRKIEKAFDALQASPTRTTADAANLERQILDEVSRLESIVGDGDAGAIGVSAERILELTNKRNRVLRLSN
jgi:hypothetical protein